MSRRSQRASEYVHCPFCGRKQTSREIVAHTEECLAERQKVKETKKAKTEQTKERAVPIDTHSSTWDAFIPGTKTAPSRFSSPAVSSAPKSNLKRSFDSWTADNHAVAESANVPSRLEKFCVTQDAKIFSLQDEELTNSYTGPQITVMLKDAQAKAVSKRRNEAAAVAQSQVGRATALELKRQRKVAEQKAAKLQPTAKAFLPPQMQVQMSQIQQQQSAATQGWYAQQMQLQQQQVQRSLMIGTGAGYYDQQFMAQQLAQQMYGQQFVGMNVNSAIMQQQQMLQQQAQARQAAASLAAQQQAAELAEQMSQSVEAPKVQAQAQVQQQQKAEGDGAGEGEGEGKNTEKKIEIDLQQGNDKPQQEQQSQQQDEPRQAQEEQGQEQGQEQEQEQREEKESEKKTETAKEIENEKEMVEGHNAAATATVIVHTVGKPATASLKSKAACLAYVQEVQSHPTFKKYTEFAQILKDHKNKQTEPSEVASRVGELMKDFPDLKEGFKAFVPELHRNMEAPGQTVGEASGEQNRKEGEAESSTKVEKSEQVKELQLQQQIQKQVQDQQQAQLLKQQQIAVEQQRRQMQMQQLVQQQQQQQLMLQQQLYMQQQQLAMQPGYNHVIQQQLLQQQQAQSLQLQIQHQVQRQQAQQQQVLEQQQEYPQLQAPQQQMQLQMQAQMQAQVQAQVHASHLQQRRRQQLLEQQKQKQQQQQQQQQQHQLLLDQNPALKKIEAAKNQAKADVEKSPEVAEVEIMPEVAKEIAKVDNPPEVAEVEKTPKVAKVEKKLEGKRDKRDSALDLLAGYKSRLPELKFNNLLSILHKASQAEEPGDLMERARGLLGNDKGDFDTFLSGM
ncbi:hypothetical protein TrVE_jg11547 [Triparma verrucosa]|uniref:Uncharacterized protein n=1 Tax=Triparma verrucosa TaxID=1606542 RepID=A0A9W7EVC8_9STRA|nr:hypothetical protein TrVE_jg11547 [Triparma verrucosa]